MSETRTLKLAEVERRARRRWKLLILGILPVAVILGLIGAYVGGHGRRRRPSVHHHSSTAAVMIVLAILLALLVAEVIFIVWMHKKHRGLFGAQLIMGLPYRQRRSVMKAVRQGEPPADPTLRAVGYSVATRATRFAKFSWWAFAIAAVAQAVNAFLPDRPLGVRAFFILGALIFAGLIPYQRRNIAGARRYLTADTAPTT